jgi:hypothetical protein
MQRRWHGLGLVAIGGLLLGLALATPLSADTRGAALNVVYGPFTQGVRISDGTASGGSAHVIGNGFGPGEVVSIYITFPDGRVFPVVNLNGIANPPQCCAQNDEVLADGTGSFFFRLRFGPYYNGNQSYPSTTGSATDGVQFTDSIFILPPEFANSVPPYGKYVVTTLGRVSLQKASTSFTITASTPDDFSRTTTGTLAVFTTIGHRTSAKQVDPGLEFTGVTDNPNVDIACNGLIPGEFVTFWDTYPAGDVLALSTIAADDGGSAIIQLDLLTGKFPTGLHTFSCRGNQSNYTMTGAFLLLPGGYPASSIGTLTVSYVGASQAVANATFPQLPSFFASDYLLLTARNMRPNETVTFWQTFPDQTAHFLATVKANEAGVAVVVIQLFPGPINYQVGNAILGDSALYQIAYPAGVDGRIPTGRHWFSARGDTTVRTVIAPFDLLPSQVDP